MASKQATVVSQALSDREAVRSAYVHLPFCKRRCYYCDFPVTVAGKHATGEATPAMLDYVDLLKQEMSQQPASSASLSTIFFGAHALECPSVSLCVTPRSLTDIASCLQVVAHHLFSRHSCFRTSFTA